MRGPSPQGGTTLLAQDAATPTPPLPPPPGLSPPNPTTLGAAPVPPPGLPAAPCTAPWTKATEAYFERHLTLVAENVQAALAVGRTPPVIPETALGLLCTHDGIGRTLKGLAYDPGAKLPWERLGISWDEGPIPEQNLIETRVRLGQQVLAYMLQTLNPDDPGLFFAAAATIEADGDACRGLLPTLRRARAKRAEAWACRIREVERPFLLYLHDTWLTHPDDLLAVQCSDLQGLGDDTPLRLLPPPAARELHRQVMRNAQRGAEALDATLADRCLLWAPDDASQLGRMAAALRTVRRGNRQAQLRLLTSRPVLPGAASAAVVTDYWASPLLQGEVGKMVVDITFLEPPVRLLLEGDAGPRLQEHHMAVVTLGEGDGTLPTPSVRRWAESLTEETEVDAVIVDFPTDRLDEVQQELRRHSDPEIVSWSRPRTSQGDRDARLALYGYTGAATPGFALQLELLVHNLRRRLQAVPEVAIGHTSLLADPGALVVTFTNSAGMLSELANCDQFVFLTSKKGAMLTTVAQPVWQQALTRQASAGGERIISIAYRRSTRGGRVWVSPDAVSPAQAAALQGDWSSMGGPARTEVLIQLRGDWSDDVGPWLRALATKMGSLGGPPPQLQGLEDEPAMNTLTPIAAADGNWDGGVLFVARTPDQAQMAASRLNNLCIPGASGTSRLRVNLRHDFNETGERLVPTLGKSGRRARRAGRPSA